MSPQPMAPVHGHSQPMKINLEKNANRGWDSRINFSMATHDYFMNQKQDTKVQFCEKLDWSVFSGSINLKLVTG